MKDFIQWGREEGRGKGMGRHCEYSRYRIYNQQMQLIKHGWRTSTLIAKHNHTVAKHTHMSTLSSRANLG